MSDWLAIGSRLRSDVLEPIKERLVGKDEIIEVLGVSLIAGENTFLLGPPGTAKSALVNELAARLGGTSFDYLLTRFTEPSELFGPFDLRRLREGDLVTNTEGMLPEADFVFLDELLNANSAVLNSLLLTLNERVFRRGRETRAVPMLLAIGASNRLPDDEALAALFDRFLLRVHCDNVETSRLGEVLSAGWRRDKSSLDQAAMSVEDIRVLQDAVTEIDLSPALPAYLRAIERLREAGMPISDRRAVRLQRVLAASAIICGRKHAEVSDIWVLRYIWDVPAQREMLAAQVQNVLDEFSGRPASEQEHPLSDPGTGPDPDQLAAALNEIENESNNPRAADALTLIAARIQWIKNPDSRDHLLQRLNDIRKKVDAHFVEHASP